MIEFRKLLHKIMDELSKKATNERIDELVRKLDEKDKKIESLEARVKELEKSKELFERKIDDNESCHRRHCLRITGLLEFLNPRVMLEKQKRYVLKK